jgi:SAM-dependent methyltransferase
VTPRSLLSDGRYSLGWVKVFYDQASIWWGPDPQPSGVHPARVQTVQRLCGTAPRRILELGAGTGASAAALADAGYDVVGVDLSERTAYAAGLAARARAGSLSVVREDFYTVQLAGRFDIICCWETFGLGADADQRRLLRRMADDWLAPRGSVLMDVYSPFRPAHDAGTEEQLPPLPGVPGSVDMIERCHFDPVHCRWTDEWIPVAEPDKALAQTIRCYSPADLLLLLDGTGLSLRRIEIDGQVLDMAGQAITPSGPLMTAWSYLAQLMREDA